MDGKALPRVSSKEMLVRAGKEIAKSVVVAKTAEVGARRLGITALASSAGMMGYAGALMLARKIHPTYLDPVSANQINRDSEFCMNCHIWLHTHDPIKYENVVETMEWYCQHFARFRERVVVRDWLWPYWEAVSKIDMSQHIIFDATEQNHESMQNILSASLTQGMNPLIPLWKITVYTNYTFEDGSKGSTVIFKYHHCMGDGFSLAQTMMSLDTENVLTPFAKKEDGQGGVHAPGDLGKVAKKFASAGAKLIGMQDDPPSPVKAATLLKPLDTRVACAGTAKMPVTEIKKVCKAKGFTINDFVLGALSGAIRRYQFEKGKTVKELVDPLAGVWVALKPIQQAFSAQDINTVGEPGNESLGCVYVRLPVTHECKNPFDRVQMVADEISKLKGSPEPLLAQQIMRLFGLMPTSVTNPIWDAVANKISISVSNLPGPPKGWSFCGFKIEKFSVFVPPVGTISTFALITSFDDYITLSLSLDGNIFGKEDAKFLTEAFDAEISQLVSENQTSRL